MSHPSRPRPLFELLLEAEIVHKDLLDRIQRYCEKSGRPLWFGLLREGLQNETQLFSLLDEKLKLPVLEDDQLDGVVVAPELKQTITGALAGHLGILPLERSTDGRKAALAMVDPTLDLSTLLPKLASHGVVEIRRFLIRLRTLRLGMDMFYNQPWEPGDSAPLVADESVQALTQKAAARTSVISGEQKPVSAPTVPSSSGEQKPVSAPGPKTASASGSTREPKASGSPTAPRVLPPPLPPVSKPATAHSLPPRPAAPPPLPPAAVSANGSPPPSKAPRTKLGTRPFVRKKAGPLSAADLVIEDRPSNLSWDRDVLRVPSRATARETPQDAAGPGSSPGIEVLFRCATALCEKLSAVLQSDWPDLVVGHCAPLCDRLGLLPRSQKELLFLARLFAVLEVSLCEKGPLPPLRKERLGFACDDSIEQALSALQNEFLDFLQLPQDDSLPFGVRIITVARHGLALFHDGHRGDALAEKLGFWCTDKELIRLFVEHVTAEPPTFNSRNRPPREKRPQSETAEKTNPPIVPKAPDVPYQTEYVSGLSEEGLVPYPARDSEKTPQVYPQ